MSKIWIVAVAALILTGCATDGQQGTSAELDDVEFGGPQPWYDEETGWVSSLGIYGETTWVNKRLYQVIGTNAQGYQEFRRVRDDAVCVLVPAGHFYKRAYMDTPPNQPVDGEYIDMPAMMYDKYEITNAQVTVFLNQCEDTIFKDGTLFGPDGKRPWAIKHKWGMTFDGGRAEPQQGYENHPFVGGSGYLAEAYAEWVGGKLPRGMQYEKAAAGPSGLLFPWGQIDEKPDSTKCNGYLTGPQHTMPVGSYPKGISPYGLHDMAGNVYERAYWDDGVPKDDTPAKLATMIKGGGWVSPNWWNFRCVCRCGQPMNAMEGSVGFRVVVTEGLDALVDSGPKLRTFVDTYDAYEEAEARNCPIFLYLGFER
ncbi:SUMF1/EgtB/PvdO family nonheme iron enzyme [Planctomycetota bacterium]|nr:SUMF1/EgtB/PvdO family nonheme iron enzyme [Planctomycetota bacterium]